MKFIWRMATFCGRPVLLACDGRCDKAWGINGRPKRQLSLNDDDYVFRSDGELGTAPGPGLTATIAEGEDIKPSSIALERSNSRGLNKWCCRECERCAMVDEGEPLIPRDMSRPRPNCPHLHPGWGKP